ncbi:polysaccharide deacetylase family protein [Thermoactinospora rubra]|uniref:polysaccharide deacetylase family protein n=1 Tax=Thermoactinospora rubra TaxID=1088767 RepID=UPI000A0FC960|nr:polysaccharide deacetylase family protein [Thermoactinospora rubra]
MRRWAALPAVVTVAAGCVSPRATLHAEPPRVPPAVDAQTLARRLAAMDPLWPGHAHEPVDCATRECVALTFDDGPGKHTGRLLDLLREHGVRATFFVLGEKAAEDRHGTLRRMVDDGHELGNHTWTHRQLTTLSSAGIRNELRRTQRLVEHLTGVRMRMMRPPFGATGRRVAAESRREGLAQVLWDVDTVDWRDRVPSVVARRAGRARAGSVVLLHDIHRSTVEAMPELLSRLSHKGYAFVTVSELYGTPLAPGREYPDRQDARR